MSDTNRVPYASRGYPSDYVKCGGMDKVSYPIQFTDSNTKVPRHLVRPASLVTPGTQRPCFSAECLSPYKTWGLLPPWHARSPPWHAVSVPFSGSPSLLLHSPLGLTPAPTETWLQDADSSGEDNSCQPLRWKEDRDRGRIKDSRQMKFWTIMQTASTTRITPTQKAIYKEEFWPVYYVVAVIYETVIQKVKSRIKVSNFFMLSA